jgi:hypothetical protein
MSGAKACTDADYRRRDESAHVTPEEGGQMPSATNAHQRVAANIRGASQTPAAAFQAPVASCGIPGITLPPRSRPRAAEPSDKAECGANEPEHSVRVADVSASQSPVNRLVPSTRGVIARVRGARHTEGGAVATVLRAGSAATQVCRPEVRLAARDRRARPTPGGPRAAQGRVREAAGGPLAQLRTRSATAGGARGETAALRRLPIRKR